MKRTDLVVPAGRVASLDIPALAVTTGEAGPEWVDVPVSMWRFRRQPSQRLPLDAGSAKRARRYIRLAPWSPLTSVFLVGSVSATVGSWPAAGSLLALVVALAPALLSFALTGHELPRQAPRLTRSGDLRIPEVPEAVAREWVDRNPGVVATDEPAPHAHSRRFYIAWSAGLVTAAVALLAVRPGDGVVWVAAAGLILLGGWLAIKILPPGTVGFESTEPS